VAEQGSILLEQKGEIALLASQGSSLGGDLYGLRVDVGKQGEENMVLRTKVLRPRPLPSDKNLRISLNNESQP
jgi:hypothetical protein